MRFAYIATELPIEAAAELLRDAALPNGTIEERDGLNLGGGQYFRVKHEDISVIVCWSENYASPPAPRFHYCAYTFEGDESELDRIASQLSAKGVEVQIGKD